MKVIYFKRKVSNPALGRVGDSTADIIYFPDKNVAASRLNVGFVSSEYELNSYKAILDECTRVNLGQEPYSTTANISGIKNSEFTEREIDRFINDLKAKKDLTDKINGSDIVRRNCGETFKYN